MDLIKLTTEEYTDFVDNQKNKSFYQTLEYARFLGELDYEYDFIELKDNYQNIHAASLIAYKKINNTAFFLLVQKLYPFC